MNRRKFLKSAAVVAGASLVGAPLARAALPAAKITKVNVYTPPNLNPIFNQSNMVVTIETDIGLVGIGEGGTLDTLTQCAGRLIGRNPFDIEAAWQDMYRAWFYPPGREKIDALGALDLALWDLKGKALDVPVYDLLGGMARKHVETYLGGGGTGQRLKDAAKAAMDQGYRAFRIDAASLDRSGSDVYNSHERARQVIQDCKDMREGVGQNGEFIIDLHQRFDYSDAMFICKALEELQPYYVEDPVRTEAFNEDIPKLRQITSVPIAAGEEWGQRWDFNKLVEAHDIDYVRATLPNVGGITEMVKIAAMCETHFVGITPHFTGPISIAALVHALGPFSGPVILEVGGNNRPASYLPECLDFKDGKAWPNKRPGLGVTLDLTKVKQIGAIDTFAPGRNTYERPDGSYTNW
jgi:L-alanine-DL-glutamate epimerase-like enolase superfamily enzyme